MKKNRGSVLLKSRVNKLVLLKSILFFPIFFALIILALFGTIWLILLLLVFLWYIIWLIDSYIPYLIIYEEGILIRSKKSATLWFIRKFIPFEQITDAKIIYEIRKKNKYRYFLDKNLGRKPYERKPEYEINELVIDVKDHKSYTIDKRFLANVSKKALNLILKHKKG